MPGENPIEDDAYTIMQRAQTGGQAEGAPPAVVPADAVAEAFMAATPVAEEAEDVAAADVIRVQLGVPAVAGEVVKPRLNAQEEQEALDAYRTYLKREGSNRISRGDFMSTLESTELPLGAGSFGADAPGAAAAETAEKSIDAVAINNRIVNLSPSERAREIDAMSHEKISAVAKHILASSEGGVNKFDSVYGMLKNFQFAPKLVAKPEVTQALKNLLSAGQQFYDVDRILRIPAFPRELLADQSVHNALKESLRSFVAGKSEQEMENERALIGRLDMGLTGDELREIAEGLKLKNGGAGGFSSFVRIFGANRLYPELGGHTLPKFSRNGFDK